MRCQIKIIIQRIVEPLPVSHWLRLAKRRVHVSVNKTIIEGGGRGAGQDKGLGRRSGV